MLIHARASLPDSGFLVNIWIFTDRGPNPAAIGVKPLEWPKLILRGLGMVMVALPPFLHSSALTLGCTLWKPRWLMSCRDSRLGPGQALSFLFYFQLRTQMSDWNRAFINISCLAIQERANQNIVNIMPGEMSPLPMVSFTSLFPSISEGVNKY